MVFAYAGQAGGGSAEDQLKALLSGGSSSATHRLDQYSTGGPSSTVTSSSDPVVFMGLQHDPVQRALPPGSRNDPAAPSSGFYTDDRIGPYRVAQTSTLMQKFYDMSPTKQRKLAKKLWLAGLVSGATAGLEDANLDDIANAYERLLGMSADRFSAGKAVTPNQLLDSAIDFIWGKRPKGVSVDKLYEKARNDYSLATGGGGGSATSLGPKYPLVTQHRNRVVDLSSPAEAKAFLRSSMMQLLGRDPSQEEVDDFTAMLNSNEEDNPQVTSSKTTTMRNGNSRTRTRVIDDGFTSAESQELAEDEVRSKPGYAEWQAVSTYMPALFDMLGPVA